MSPANGSVSLPTRTRKEIKNNIRYEPGLINSHFNISSLNHEIQINVDNRTYFKETTNKYFANGVKRVSLTTYTDLLPNLGTNLLAKLKIVVPLVLQIGRLFFYPRLLHFLFVNFFIHIPNHLLKKLRAKISYLDFRLNFPDFYFDMII